MNLVRKSISSSFLFILMCCFMVTSRAASSGTVSASAVSIRTGAGVSYAQLKDNLGANVQLNSGHAVSIEETIETSDVTYPKWHKISFTFNENSYTGYIFSGYIAPMGEEVVDEEPAEPETLNENRASSAFETQLTAQGFPESYKPLLRTLHEQYPNWTFKSLLVNINWSDVITNQSKLGVNLITNSKNDNWKSAATGAYNWLTDKYTVYDGTSWVAPASGTVAYYLDPRNFLTESGIFQYESLSYVSSSQTEAGVKSILSNTFMNGKTIAYNGGNYTYPRVFMKAATYSTVSPYHLAARVKQEVGVNGSISTSGTQSGYEGYFNFYNIGATHSTNPALNGLAYAKDADGSRAKANPTYLLPWNNQYKAIVGGSQFIGKSYIAVGQNTLYFQKFDFVGTPYTHQYMANIEAPMNEGKSVLNTYKAMSMHTSAMEFIIPVYKNMPATASRAPANTGNPNNYLKTLTVSGYRLTPTFDPAKTGTYSIIVGEDVSSIKIAATMVTTKSTLTGIGTKEVKPGNNTFSIQVKAQNGRIRSYRLDVYREVSTGTTPGENPNNGDEPEVQVSLGSGIKASGTTVMGIQPVTSVATGLNKFTVTNGTKRVVTSKGVVKTSGYMATGDKIQFLSQSGNVVKEYTLIIYGDVNGSGSINVSDILLIQRHILRRQALSGPYLTAANTNKSAGSLNVADLIIIQRHILKLGNILQ